MRSFHLSLLSNDYRGPGPRDIVYFLEEPLRPYQQNVAEILSELETSLQGISSVEAGPRLARYGPNELIEKKKKTAFAMFFDQFRDFMILVLIAAAVISGFIGELSDTIAIIVIVVLNAVIGFTQEYRAEKAMEALKTMAGLTATVIRDGMPATISTSETCSRRCSDS